MKKLGFGVLSELQDKIKLAKNELNEIADLDSPLPELINSTNLIRTNEHLTKSNNKQSELLSYYDVYAQHLETVLMTVFEIQTDLKDLLREQSKLIEHSASKKNSRKKKSK